MPNPQTLVTYTPDNSDSSDSTHGSDRSDRSRNHVENTNILMVHENWMAQ